MPRETPLSTSTTCGSQSNTQQRPHQAQGDLVHRLSNPHRYLEELKRQRWYHEKPISTYDHI
ncbi:MAG: hypothetical protein Q9198_004465, partial [Flavoplaca austrocitrina]